MRGNAFYVSRVGCDNRNDIRRRRGRDIAVPDDSNRWHCVNRFHFGGQAMQIELCNFGKFTQFYYEFSESNTHPNGWGKTTLINAYIWALTGRTLNGFEPRRVDATDDAQTSVVVRMQNAERLVTRRILGAKGTELYVSRNGSPYVYMANADVSELLRTPLRVACADASILTDASLTSEQLRKFLAVTDVMDLEEVQRLRKEAATLRKQLKAAEQYALTNVAIPTPTVAELSKVDVDLIKRFEQASHDMIKYAQSEVCPACGQKLPLSVIDENAQRCADAKAFVDAWRDEYTRLSQHRADYEREQQAIEDTKRLISNAQNARKDVARITEQLAGIDAQLQVLDAKAINATLPEGVEVQTSKTAKSTGAASSTCTLLYKGVPLKSVNYAQRVRIGIEILDAARKRVNAEDIPIFVDAAGEILDVYSIAPNLICFYAG